MIRIYLQYIHVNLQIKYFSTMYELNLNWNLDESSL